MKQRDTVWGRKEITGNEIKTKIQREQETVRNTNRGNNNRLRQLRDKNEM